jgi:GNAT superfamily N-acetyltransferase
MGKSKGIEPVIRRLDSGDSIKELTDMLHRAYGSLLARGMRFYATHQTVEQTMERIAEGERHVAVHDGRGIGTILWRDPSRTSGSPWYDRPDVASFGQFAVEPAFQRHGVGSKLIAFAEQRTADTGAADTGAADTGTADTGAADTGARHRRARGRSDPLLWQSWISADRNRAMAGCQLSKRDPEQAGRVDRIHRIYFFVR